MATSHLLRSRRQTILSRTSATTATESFTFKMPIADSYTLVMDTGAGTGTSPTLDITVQSSIDGGTTWVICPIRSTQKTTAAAVEIFTFRPNLGDNEAGYAQVVAATGGQLCKNFVPADYDNMRVTCTIAGTSPSFASLKFYLFSHGRG